ncbi:MAG: class I adenylate-forming enzyme family protein, partial [Oscillospiraceae bacterium]
MSYFLTWNATMFPERLAVVHKDKKLTYRQLDRASSRLANSLCGLGVKKGDRVAFLLPNSLETVIVWYATQKIGATAVPVNSRLMNDEIAYILNDSNCAALIYHERFAETAEHLRLNCPALRQLICKRENPETESLDFDALIAAGSEKEPQARIDGEDESIILYTSGTTGKSKGVMHTQQMVR